MPSDAPDLSEWLGRDEIYTYWGRKASAGEKNPATLFVDPRPHAKRKPSTDYNWMLVLEKCGFLREGTVRQGKMGSVYCDYHIYGLLKSDIQHT